MEEEGKNMLYREVMPFSVMVTMECLNVGLNTLFKAATLHGMSSRIFIVYAYGVAAIVLLPSPFLSHRSRVLPPVTFSLIWKVFLLGVIGCVSQEMGYTGINYSSPTLASAMSNLIPAFTFILAVIFRMEKVAVKSRSTQAKIIGTMISIMGASVVTMYKGPAIIVTRSPETNLRLQMPSNWVLGGICLVGENVLIPMWYILQTQIMKEYPDETSVIFFYNLCVSILAALVGLVTERDVGAWRIGLNIGLASVLCSGVFGSFVNNVVHSWALRKKGPVYVTMFKPLSIAIAVAMGVVLLGDTLYLGSIVGAMIISLGFYTVMWGKSKEEIGGEDPLRIVDPEMPSSKAPLLLNDNGRNLE